MRQRLTVQRMMHTLPTRQQAACRHSIKPGIAIARRIAREPNNEHELMTIGVRNIGIIKLGSLTFVSVSRKRLDLLLTSGGENLFFPGCLRRRGETRRPEAAAPTIKVMDKTIITTQRAAFSISARTAEPPTIPTAQSSPCR